jgi:terminase small subunit-like protein
MARELEAAILAAMGDSPLQLSGIAALVDRSPKDGSVRNALRRLVDAGEIARDGRMYVKVALSAAPCTLSPGTPAPPDALGVAGREAWLEAWAVKWTGPPDRAAIMALARAEDQAVCLIGAVDEAGVVQKRPIVSPRGDVVGSEYVAHPLLAELRRLDKQLESLRARLGLDPTSRARLGVEMFTERPDALDELRERRRERLSRDRGLTNEEGTRHATAP